MNRRTKKKAFIPLRNSRLMQSHRPAAFLFYSVGEQCLLSRLYPLQSVWIRVIIKQRKAVEKWQITIKSLMI